MWIELEFTLTRTSFTQSALVILLSAVVVASGCTSSRVSSDIAVSDVADKQLSIDNSDLEHAGSRTLSAIKAASEGDTSLLSELIVETGLHVYPPFACEPTVLSRDNLSNEILSRSFTIANCHEDDVSERPTKTWSQFFQSIDNSKAITDTERIALNQPHGIGFNTGSSTLAEKEFSADSYQLVVYFFLGTAAGDYRDWDEVGFVFDSSTKPLSLVAIYHDVFSST